jgi:hypothetical protein
LSQSTHQLLKRMLQTYWKDNLEMVSIGWLDCGFRIADCGFLGILTQVATYWEKPSFWPWIIQYLPNVSISAQFRDIAQKKLGFWWSFPKGGNLGYYLMCDA